MSRPAREICEMTEMYEACCVSKESLTSMPFMCACSVIEAEHGGGCYIEFVEGPLAVILLDRAGHWRHSPAS